MTKYQIEVLNTMRGRGKSAMDIALALHISVNTIRSYMRRHPPEDVLQVECLWCGKPIVQVKGRKAKRFCSDKCRNTWWNAHPEKVQRKAYYRLTCAYCGKEFESYGNRNTAPVPAMPMQEALILYRILSAMLEHRCCEGELDEQTRDRAKRVLAVKTGMTRDSIFL